MTESCCTLTHGEFALRLTVGEARDVAKALELAAVSSAMEQDFKISVGDDVLVQWPNI